MIQPPMLITQTFEAFETTLANEAQADRVEITTVPEGVNLKFWRGEAMCERTVTDAEMDQPWENIALAAKEALDG